MVSAITMLPDAVHTATTCEFCGAALATVVVFGKPRPCYGSCGCARSAAAYAAVSDRPATKAERRRTAYARAGIGLEYMASIISCGQYVEAVKGGRNVFITGGNGTGKSTLAASIARTLIDGGLRVVFANSAQALDQERGSYNGGLSRWDSLCSCDVLVLDDLGKENHTEWAQSMLYTLTEARFAGKLPTVTTSNYNGGALVARLGGGSTAQAIVSRLVGGALAVRMDGRDMRLKKEAEEFAPATNPGFSRRLTV